MNHILNSSKSTKPSPLRSILAIRLSTSASCCAALSCSVCSDAKKLDSTHFDSDAISSRESVPFLSASISSNFVRARSSSLASVRASSACLAAFLAARALGDIRRDGLRCLEPEERVAGSGSGSGSGRRLGSGSSSGSGSGSGSGGNSTSGWLDATDSKSLISLPASLASCSDGFAAGGSLHSSEPFGCGCIVAAGCEFDSHASNPPGSDARSQPMALPSRNSSSWRESCRRHTGALRESPDRCAPEISSTPEQADETEDAEEAWAVADCQVTSSIQPSSFTPASSSTGSTGMPAAVAACRSARVHGSALELAWRPATTAEISASRWASPPPVQIARKHDGPTTCSPPQTSAHATSNADALASTSLDCASPRTAPPCDTSTAP